jgi:UTP15-like protein
MMDELVDRGGLRAAIGGRDEVALEPLLEFVCKEIACPDFAPLLLDVAGVRPLHRHAHCHMFRSILHSLYPPTYRSLLLPHADNPRDLW